MKKILLTFLAISFLFISCGDDNDAQVSITDSDLIGTWKLTELYSKNTKITATTNVGISTSSDVEITTKDYINPTTTFENNPKKVYDNGSFVLVTKFSFQGQEKTVEQGIIAKPELKSDWSLENGNTLKFSIQNQIATGEIAAEIISFDENNLKIKAILSQDYDIPSELSSTISNAKINGELYLSYTK